MKSDAAKTAKAIKNILKKNYPETKFSVISKYFAGGNSVTVSWNLGPTSKEIEKLISQFQYGHFDGMEDLYEYSNVVKDIPQVKWVSTSREYQTPEEIENNKLKWNDPIRLDLWQEERTFYHIVAKDLCKAMKVKYNSLDQTVLPEFQYMVSGYINPPLQALVTQLLAKTSFQGGYHGVRNEKSETGELILNSFELF